MKKQLSLFTVSLTLLALLSLTSLQCATEFPSAAVDGICLDELAALKIASKKLWQAAKDGDLRMAKQALADGADINGYAQYNPSQLRKHNLPLTTPLETAACAGNLSIVQFLLELGALVDARVHNTALIELCGMRNASRPMTRAIVTTLLAHKADVNAEHYYFRNTSLCRAIFNLQDECVVRQLILAGADTNLTILGRKISLDEIETPTMRKAIEEAVEERACIISARKAKL